MKEIVPELTEHVKLTLADAGYTTPQFVPVVPDPNSLPNECWMNVPTLCSKQGGEPVSGRMVWIDDKQRWLHLEAHCLWLNPDGTLSDPTPKRDGESHILFVAEPLKWQERVIPSRYLPLTDDKWIAKWLRLMVAFQEILALHPPHTPIPIDTMSYAQQVLMRQKLFLESKLFPEDFEAAMKAQGLPTEQMTPRKYGLNDPCPCKSGRRFKNCCNRW